MTRKSTVPLWLAFSEPVSVHWTLPAAPIAGCVVTAHALIAAGNGAPQVASEKFVKAGVLSLMIIVETAVLALLV